VLFAYSSQKRSAVIMVLPAVLFLLAISIYPLINSFYLMFTDWTMTSGQPPRFNTFANFAQLARDRRFHFSLLVTARFTVTAVPIELALGLALALATARETAYRRICRSILLLPMMITPVVVGLMWKYMFNPSNGIFNHLLGQLGIPGPIWLGEPRPALPAIIIVDVWQWTPFVFLILSAGLSSLPREAFEAAKVDGARPLQTFWYITLPLLVPFLLVALLMRFIDSFKIFDTIFVMTKGGPANATESLSIYTYKVGLNFFDMGYACTLSYVISIIITFSTQQFLRLGRKNAQA
jgi:multiple sugar transport system permease protein